MINFDRVADIYDRTRRIPPEALNRVADRIIEATGAGPETRFLELGVGTGRIALPILARGHRYTGIDISERMMAQLRERAGDVAGRLELLVGDVTELPLPDRSVDVVIVVHVLHLVPEWRKALDEARRVTAPGGYFVMGDDRPLPDSPGRMIRRRWAEFARELGVELRPEYGSWNAIDTVLTEAGCRTAVYRAAEWSFPLKPIDLMEAQRNQVFSHSWNLPDDAMQGIHEKLLVWGKEQFGNLEEPLTNRMEFLLSVSRWME